MNIVSLWGVFTELIAMSYSPSNTMVSIGEGKDGRKITQNSPPRPTIVFYF